MESLTASAPPRADAGNDPVIPFRTTMQEKSTLRQVFETEESPLLRYAFGLVGQRETAVLASSQAAQVSFERRERDLSIMTFCLVELLRSSNGPVSLQDAYRMLQQSVPAYVERAFPGSTQTPILVDYTTPPLYLRVQ